MELLGKKLAVAALLGAMVLPAVGAVAADNNGNPAVSVTADTLEYNGKTQVATATGNVVIVRDQATMTGNKAVYNLKTAEADMEGNVSIQQPDMQLNADKVHSTNKNYVVATGSVRGVYDDKKSMAIKSNTISTRITASSRATAISKPRARRCGPTISMPGSNR